MYLQKCTSYQVLCFANSSFPERNEACSYLRRMKKDNQVGKWGKTDKQPERKNSDAQRDRHAERQIAEKRSDFMESITFVYKKVYIHRLKIFYQDK